MSDAPHDDKTRSPLPEVQTQTLKWHAGDMPYSVEFGDHFYSRADGRLECDHVFIQGNSLPQRWATGSNMTIGELGFGTGLNLCETLRQWKSAEKRPGATLRFVSFERFPMSCAEIDRALSNWPDLDVEREALCAVWPDAPSGDIDIDLGNSFHLTVVCGMALETLGKSQTMVDAWYLDGFAPSRNPDMWSLELMQQVFAHTAPGGTFATYAAAGFVRRNLQAAGFRVERVPGFADKREMLRGDKAADAGSVPSIY